MAINKQAGAWALIYCTTTGTFLFGKRSLAVKKPSVWNFFGGRIESGENARTALLRELNEEVNFTSNQDGSVNYGGTTGATLVKLGYVDGLRELHYFLIQTDSEFVPTLNHEHTDYCWFAVDKLPMRVNRSTSVAINIGLIQKAIELSAPPNTKSQSVEADYPDLE